MKLGVSDGPTYRVGARDAYASKHSKCYGFKAAGSNEQGGQLEASSGEEISGKVATHENVAVTQLCGIHPFWASSNSPNISISIKLT